MKVHIRSMMFVTWVAFGVIATVSAGAPPTSNAQVEREGSEPHLPEYPGSDLINGSLPNVRNWTNGNAIDGLLAYSVTATACNVGNEPLDWFVGPSPRHPVVAQHLYRLKNGRMEQIGQSWVKHEFCALAQILCSPPACVPTCGGCCDQLGVGCSAAGSSSGFGQFGSLGPKSEIDVHMGTNLGFHAYSEGNTTLRGRVQVRKSDLDPALNPGALYFVEDQSIAADDAQSGDMTGDNNNASYRRVSVSLPSYPLGSVGGTVRENPAIRAWEAFEANVTTQDVDIPDEGRLIFAYKVTDNGDGTWHYEYALHNLNSDRSVGAFSVPVPDDVTVTEIGFHDVDYHSGEIYSLDDWPAVDGGTAVTWATETFADNENANALRWGTLYNFRFDANTPPQPVNITIGLFKPGTPDSVSVPAMGPAEACPAPAFVPAVTGVSFSDRAFDGYIDPRVESTDGVNVDLGIDTLTIEFNTPLENVDGSPLSADAFVISDTGPSGVSVTGVGVEEGLTVTLALSEHLALQEWTTVSVQARSQCGDVVLADSINIGYLPADVDQSGAVGPFDLLVFRQLVNQVSLPEAGVVVDYADTDRDGGVSPFDLLVLRQLINGVAPATRAWAGVALPPKP